jgi:hypothetical protein
LAPLPAILPSTPTVQNVGETASTQLTDRQTAETGAADLAEPGEMHSYIYDGSPAPISSLLFPDTLLDDIYGRYGFIGSHTDEEKCQTILKWPDVRKIIGDVQSHVDHSFQAPVSHFVEGLLSLPVDDPLSRLASLWDLAKDSVSPLADHLNPRFRLDVRRANSGVVYFIDARNRTSDDVGWQLMLSDAATVLECFRQERASSIRDIALFLLQHGRPFSTCVKRSRIESPLPQLSVPLMVLGWRPQGYKPTLSEYNFYEHYRRAFFDHPRSRCAHLKGGIIWRHALECVGGLAVEHALEGPSEEAGLLGTCLELGDDVGSLWDDELSEADMELICGVYKYETSEC